MTLIVSQSDPINRRLHTLRWFSYPGCANHFLEQVGKMYWTLDELLTT